MKNERSIMYKYAPQMQLYYRNTHEWTPYLMYTNKTNLRTEVLNTDNLGLRFNSPKNINGIKSILDQKNSKETFGLIVGASTAFGLGASNDSNTVSSKLSNDTGIKFYNLGVSAFSGFQEVILHQSLINKINSAKYIFIFSGLNDLFLINYINEFNDELGPYFYSSQFQKGMNNILLNNKRKFARFIFSKFVDDSVDWLNISLKQIFKMIFKEKKIKKNILKDKEKLLKDYLTRNLTYWANIQKIYKTKIFYVLQPFPAWCKKELSLEEIEIFKELDETESSILKSINSVEELYNGYQNLIKDICNNLEINFQDSNQYFEKNIKKKEWCFIDRAHLTDTGSKHISNLFKSLLQKN